MTTRHVCRAVARCALFLAIGCLASAPAAAVVSHKAECRRITRQIDHFEDVAEMAADRGDQLWLDGTLQHIERLSERRVRLCPEYEEPNRAAIYAAWAADMIKKAARAFVTFMTFGAF